jgi:broad specificity phosphatase PhoE
MEERLSLGRWYLVPTIFYLFRHGETDWNKEKRFMGQTDIPLNDIGKEQAKNLAKRVKELGLVDLYSSDLLRAKETAELIVSQLPYKLDVKYDSRLREINGGLCEGLRVSEMKHRFPSWWKENERDSYTTRFPEGENFYDLVHRVTKTLEEISRNYSDNQKVGIVTHGGVIIALVAYILGVPHDKRDRIILDNCGITTIELGGNFPKVLSLNS